jgi:hypothetical protein
MDTLYGMMVQESQQFTWRHQLAVNGHQWKDAAVKAAQGAAMAQVLRATLALQVRGKAV